MFDEPYASGAAEQLTEAAMPQAVLAALLLVLFVLGLALAVSRGSASMGPLFGLGIVAAAGLGSLFLMGLDRPPRVRFDERDVLTIQVVAYPSRWEFVQPEGWVDGELFVPVGRVVRLQIRNAPSEPGSVALIHRLSIPALGVRALAIPGQTTEVTFRADRVGRYAILCTEFCGADHWRMRSTVEVMDPDDSNTPWSCALGGRPPDGLTESEWGERLFASNGCTACHRVDGAEGGIGPDLRDVAGRYRPLQDGRHVLADEDYLRRSIQEPEKELSEGFTGAVMPAFNLPQGQLDALVSYLHGLSPNALAPHRPRFSPRENPRD